MIDHSIPALDQSATFVINDVRPFGYTDSSLYLEQAHAVLAMTNMMAIETPGGLSNRAIEHNCYEAVQNLLSMGMLAIENEQREQLLMRAA